MSGNHVLTDVCITRLRTCRLMQWRKFPSVSQNYIAIDRSIIKSCMIRRNSCVLGQTSRQKSYAAS